MDEQRMILEMLREGKLTVEEAARLLEALQHGSGEAGSSESAGADQKEGWEACCAEFAGDLHRQIRDEMRRVREQVRHAREQARGEARRAAEQARAETGRFHRQARVEIDRLLNELWRDRA